jgi:D-glycerate 3-kinase
MDPLLLEGLAMPMLAQVEGLVGSGQRPVLALNGPVGAGKSRFCQQLIGLAQERGLRLEVASIDDAYLPWEQRLVAMAGNPFGVNRVPPGSHDAPLLVERLQQWRSGGALQLPRFDKTLRDGEGDRVVEAPLSEEGATPDGLVLEGWLMGCRPIGAAGLRAAGVAPGMELAAGLAPLRADEAAWLPHWDRQLEAYGPLFDLCDGLWLLRPVDWGLPRRWRFQAEARQRRLQRQQHKADGWLKPAELDRLVRSSLASLPPRLYQEPLTVQAKASAQLNGRRLCINIES